MATKQVQEPAGPVTDQVTEPAVDTREFVHVYDSNTGTKVDRPVPGSWLTIFPHLKETPSTKEGK